MQSTVGTPYRFGRFELRDNTRELLADGAPVALGARAYDVLTALIERRDRLVTKNELLDIVWPKLVVEENNLQVQISALRKLLGPQAITTIPGRGYKFTAPLASGVPGMNGAPHVAVRASATAIRTNIPEHLPPLYGRRDDLAELTALLGRHPLVSVVGPGGIGKTCLAQAAAQTFRNAYADGVWVIEFAPVTDPALTLNTVARTLELQIGPASRAAELAEMLASRRMLLVLDNCEHLLDAVAELASALSRHAPEVRMLTTSQEPLKLADEQVYRLGTLALPSSGTVQDAENVGAVALFVARAKAALPQFALTEGNVATVIEICRRLDGIPLAIELAAARVPLLGVDGLCARLNDRFRVLTAGARLALRRHQTLRAALEWSYGLLTADEQSVFRRLGVFAGSFDLDSAQQVVAADGIDPWAALDHLGALVDKSLVVAEGGAEPRYRLLETGRAFALEQLAADGETAAALERHARAMLALFERSQTRQWSMSTQQMLELYLGDVDNLRAALDWAAGAEGNDELLVALAGASCWIWKFATLHLEGLNRFIEVRQRIGPSTPPQIEGRFQMGLAALGHNQSVPAADMAQAIDRAIACYRKLDDREELYVALAMQARYFTAVGDIASAERVLGEALALFDPAWPAGLRSPALTARAFIMIGRDRLEEAQAAWQEQLEVDESIGDSRLAVVSLNNLIDSMFAQGKVAEAIRRGRDLVAMVRRERFSGYESFALGNLSAALTADGQLDEALEVAREGVPLLRQQGAITAFLVHFALLAARRGRLADAARALGCEEAVTAARGYQRQCNEGRAHDELHALLKERMPASERHRLIEDGAKLSVDAAVQLALSA